MRSPRYYLERFKIHRLHLYRAAKASGPLGRDILEAPPTKLEARNSMYAMIEDDCTRMAGLQDHCYMYRQSS